MTPITFFRMRLVFEEFPRISLPSLETVPTQSPTANPTVPASLTRLLFNANLTKSPSVLLFTMLFFCHLHALLNHQSFKRQLINIQ